VSQEPNLFGATIYDNISYGHHHVEYQDVVKAALMANAHSFISALPKVLRTCITIMFKVQGINLKWVKFFVSDN
jgi:ATP-binding cassette subfamily B (MDR/TAP) protein 1